MPKANALQIVEKNDPTIYINPPPSKNTTAIQKNIHETMRLNEGSYDTLIQKTSMTRIEKSPQSITTEQLLSRLN